MKFVVLAACLFALAAGQITITTYTASTTCTGAAVNATLQLDTCTSSSKFYCVSGAIWARTYKDTACTATMVDLVGMLPSGQCMVQGTASQKWSCTGSTAGITMATLTAGYTVNMMEYSDSACATMTSNGYGFATSNFTGSPPGVNPCVTTTTCTACPNANACSGYYKIACPAGGGSSNANALVVASGFLLAQVIALLW